MSEKVEKSESGKVSAPSHLPTFAPSDLSALVSEGYRLDLEIAQREQRLKEIKALLVRQGAGDYADEEGHRAQVIVPSPKIVTPPAAQLATVREIVAEKEFKTLFEHVAQWKPIKDFRAKASVLLTPAKLRRVLLICEIPTKPYVVFK